MKNKTSILLSVLLVVGGAWAGSAQAQTRPIGAIRLPQITIRTTPAPRNPSPTNSAGTSSPEVPSGCLVTMGDGLPTQYICPGSAAGTSTSGIANNPATLGGASSESLCAPWLSGSIKVSPQMAQELSRSCFGEGATPQGLPPTGSPNAQLPWRYMNSVAAGFAPSTQPGISAGVGGVPDIQGGPVIGVDKFADAGRSSQGSCDELNNSIEALINSESGGSSPNSQCSLGSSVSQLAAGSSPADNPGAEGLPASVDDATNAQVDGANGITNTAPEALPSTSPASNSSSYAVSFLNCALNCQILGLPPLNAPNSGSLTDALMQVGNATLRLPAAAFLPLVGHLFDTPSELLESAHSINESQQAIEAIADHPLSLQAGPGASNATQAGSTPPPSPTPALSPTPAPDHPGPSN